MEDEEILGELDLMINNLGKQVKRRYFDISFMQDDEVESLMLILEHSLNYPRANLINKLVEQTHISKSTLYLYRKKAEENVDYNPKCAKLMANRAVSDWLEEGIANYIRRKYIDKNLMFTTQMCRNLVKWATIAYPDHLYDKEFKISDHYLFDFRARNGLAIRMPHTHRRPEDIELLNKRIQSFNQMKEELLKELEEKGELWRVVNADESFFGCSVATGLTWAVKGAEGVDVNINHNDKKGITVIASINAQTDDASCKLPLFIICKGRTERCHNQVYDGRFITNEKIIHTENGWSSTDAFRQYLQWLRNLYDERFGSNRAYQQDKTIFLMLDTYSSHRNEATKKLAEELKFKLIFIPAGCTDVCQPLDVRVFGALKAKASKMWWQFYSINSDFVCTLKASLFILIKCWEELSPEIVESAWQEHAKEVRINALIAEQFDEQEQEAFDHAIEQAKHQDAERLNEEIEIPDFFAEISTPLRRATQENEGDEYDEDWDTYVEEEEVHESVSSGYDPDSQEFGSEQDVIPNGDFGAIYDGETQVINIHQDDSGQPEIQCAKIDLTAGVKDYSELGQSFQSILNAFERRDEVYLRELIARNQSIPSELPIACCLTDRFNKKAVLMAIAQVFQFCSMMLDNPASMFRNDQLDSDPVKGFSELIEQMTIRDCIRTCNGYKKLEQIAFMDPRIILSELLNPDLFGCSIRNVDDPNVIGDKIVAEVPDNVSIERFLNDSHIIVMKKYIFLAVHPGQQIFPDYFEVTSAEIPKKYMLMMTINHESIDGIVKYIVYKRNRLKSEFWEISKNGVFNARKDRMLKEEYIGLYIASDD